MALICPWLTYSSGSARGQRSLALIRDLFYGGAVAVKDGFAELPDRAGLGVDIDEKVAAKHPYQPANRPNYVFSDGAVGDH